jgi:hypothetical protein
LIGIVSKLIVSASSLRLNQFIVGKRTMENRSRPSLKKLLSKPGIHLAGAAGLLTLVLHLCMVLGPRNYMESWKWILIVPYFGMLQVDAVIALGLGWDWNLNGAEDVTAFMLLFMIVVNCALVAAAYFVFVSLIRFFFD